MSLVAGGDGENLSFLSLHEVVCQNSKRIRAVLEAKHGAYAQIDGDWLLHLLRIFQQPVQSVNYSLLGLVGGYEHDVCLRRHSEIGSVVAACGYSCHMGSVSVAGEFHVSRHRSQFFASEIFLAVAVAAVGLHEVILVPYSPYAAFSVAVSEVWMSEVKPRVDYSDQNTVAFIRCVNACGGVHGVHIG